MTVGFIIGSMLICHVVMSCLFDAAAGTISIQPYIEPRPNGRVNWTAGIVQVKGVGVPQAKDSGKSPETNARILSLAQINAKRNLIDVLNSICVSSDAIVKDLISGDDSRLSQLVDMAYNAPELEAQRKYLTDGTVEIYLQFRLFGGFSQLVLPQEIKQIQPLSLVLPENKAPAETNRQDASAEAPTGLVVDARGFALSPALAPRILDEKEQEVYGATVISREFAVQQGVFQYIQGMPPDEQMPRVGPRPLTVKGLRASGPNRCDVVISNNDAAKIKRFSAFLSFLKQCRVVVLMDAAGTPEDSNQ